MMKRKTTALIGSAAAIAIALTGCSSKASDSGNSGGGDSGDLKTDVGVTDDTITLAALVDHSGVFKTLSLAFTVGNEIWADEVNEAGGICGRQIELEIKDTGYKVDNAVPMYAQVKDTSLGMMQLVGSHILAALKQSFVDDQMVVSPGSWASSNLDAPEVMIVGMTYDVEMINGLHFLQNEGKIKDGDKIGHIYTDSEYGQGGLLGSEYYAQQHGMTVVPAPIGGTDTDMTATITKMKAEGVTAIAITTPPGAVNSAVTQNVAQALNVPIIGSNPTFSPTFFADQATADALQYYYLISSVAPFDAEGVDIAGQVAEKYKEKTQDEPNIGVNQMYVVGLAWQAILEKACEDGDMTRAGILAAKETIDNVDSEGLAGPLDFSVPGKPSQMEAYILTPDANAPDKLKIAADLFEAPELADYKAPHQE